MGFNLRMFWTALVALCCGPLTNPIAILADVTYRSGSISANGRAETFDCLRFDPHGGFYRRQDRVAAGKLVQVPKGQARIYMAGEPEGVAPLFSMTNHGVAYAAAYAAAGNTGGPEAYAFLGEVYANASALAGLTTGCTDNFAESYAEAVAEFQFEVTEDYHFVLQGQPGKVLISASFWSGQTLPTIIIPEGTNRVEGTFSFGVIYRLRVGVNADSYDEQGPVTRFGKVDFCAFHLGLTRNGGLGDSPFVPVMPDTTTAGTAGTATADFADVPSGKWVDPPLSPAFRYQTTDGSLFTAILDFPPGFAEPFTVRVGNETLGQFGPGQPASFTNFPGGGVASFLITNIVPTNGAVVVGFPVKLEFNAPTADLKISVPNEPPVAVPLQVATAPNTPLGLHLSATDPDGNALEFVFPQLPEHGALSGQPPDILYTPTTNYSGPDSFTYLVNDGLADSAPATVSIKILPLLTGARHASGGFEFNLLGQAGRVFEVQISSNLVDWEYLRLLTNLDGMVNFQEPETPAPASRFFRARLVE